MSEARWAEADTTPERIETALRELVRELHAADETLVPARVLNLVVVADREWRGEVANRLERIGRNTASRTIFCTVEEGRTRLDATATISGEPAADGRVGVLRELVEIELGAGHLGRLDTIIDPIVVSALPTVLWSPHGRDEAVESLVGLTDTLLIDTDDPTYFDGPGAALDRAAELLDSNVYVVDLAWLRTLPWRERLAGSFQDPQRRSALTSLKRIYLRYNPGSVVSAILLVGWLASRLGWTPAQLTPGKGDTMSGTARREGGGTVTLEFEPVAQMTRGIAGVTVTGDAGFSLSLDRGPGGLTAREQRAGARPQQWRVMGASRGEAGILGEGVRQAMLQDQTYRPALHAARSFSP
ncbi:MAG TPA: glucose-6-phosphate dehydrogenase assembly protein OpcA [Solirubrobacteraceae bacterium]|nr:glucose-6-phosphate dehydrogenase assembly protein OpcA [Solirubrobacteraceae bacterium]